MAVNIIEDLTEGAGGGWTAKGRTRQRIFYLENLVSNGPGIWSEVERELRQQKGIAYGAPHNPDSELVVIDWKHGPFKNSKTQAKSTVIYGTPDSSGFAFTPRISFTGTTRAVQTMKELDGSIIKVQYINARGKEDVRTSTVTAWKSYGTLIVERLEDAIPTLALSAQGAMNADQWQGQEKYTWLVRLVEFTPAIFAVGYLVSYHIEFDEETHVPVAAYQNGFGIVPEDIDDVTRDVRGNGWYRPDVIKLFNYGALHLPDIFAQPRSTPRRKGR